MKSKHISDKDDIPKAFETFSRNVPKLIAVVASYVVTKPRSAPWSWGRGSSFTCWSAHWIRDVHFHSSITNQPSEKCQICK